MVMGIQPFLLIFRFVFVFWEFCYAALSALELTMDPRLALNLWWAMQGSIVNPDLFPLLLSSRWSLHSSSSNSCRAKPWLETWMSGHGGPMCCSVDVRATAAWKGSRSTQGGKCMQFKKVSSALWISPTFNLYLEQSWRYLELCGITVYVHSLVCNPCLTV